MIELLIDAESALAEGRLDDAERRFRQVAAADPRSAMAVTGLARVAAARGDDATAATEAERALALDPDSPSARRIVAELADRAPLDVPSPPAVGAPRPGLLDRFLGRRR